MTIERATRVVVVGGTGRVGSRLCALLQKMGHHTVPASPSTGVDAATGRGLDAALRDARVVVDVSNPRARGDAEVSEFFRTSTLNLLAAEETAGVEHHVLLSIVGCDLALGSAYLRAKADQERAVEAGRIAHTIVRATQFFEFLEGIIEAATDGGTVRLPQADLQPIAVDDVAAVLAEVATGAPAGRVDLAGPERFCMSELARRVLVARGDGRQVVNDADATYFGAMLRRGTLVPGRKERLGRQRFQDWLRGTGN